MGAEEELLLSREKSLLLGGKSISLSLTEGCTREQASVHSSMSCHSLEN